jgi:hypothetical protein
MDGMRGSLRKLPSGSWEIRLFLGTDDTGKKRYRSKSVKGSKREAERTMRELIAEIEAGDVESDRSEQLLTVDELLVRWRAANINDWSPTTARDHKRAAESWISPHIGTGADQPADGRAPGALLPHLADRRRQIRPPVVATVGQEGPQHRQGRPLDCGSLAAHHHQPGA